VAERAGQPGFPGTGRAADQQMLAVADPAAGRERLEQATIEPARRAQIGVFYNGVLPQPGDVQSPTEPLVVARSHLAIDQQTEPVVARQIVGRRLVAQLEERVGHCGQAKAAQALRHGMDQHGSSFQW
jgi:hypothetical protein